MAKKSITFKVNGKEVSVDVSPGEMLVDVLREKLGLTGTKVGCREGECGVCSVILDGKLNGAIDLAEREVDLGERLASEPELGRKRRGMGTLDDTPWTTAPLPAGPPT